MMTTTLSRRFGRIRRILSSLTVLAFVSTLAVPPGAVSAQTLPTILGLPAPGTMLPVSAGFRPPVLMGMTVYPDDPLKFDFFVSRGDDKLEGQVFADESVKLIKYFLAGLTVPENELWVNLSPYEEGRIVTDTFGRTEMGRDLLAQDYLLKQLTASLIYPEDDLGRQFWARVYKKAQERYGTTDIPLNTFNKVWIVPDNARVYMNGYSAFVVNSRLKVMLEEDYLAREKNLGNDTLGTADLPNEQVQEISEVTSEVIREIVIPEIEKEVNEGKTFAPLRQVYQSMILGVWFKSHLREGLLGKIYVDQGKTAGVDVDDPAVKEKIYQQYLAAFKQGVYNLIKEEPDPGTGRMIPRKYFSGGMEVRAADIKTEGATTGDIYKGVETRVEPSDTQQLREDGHTGVAMVSAVGANATPDNEEQLRLTQLELTSPAKPGSQRPSLRAAVEELREITQYVKKREQELNQELDVGEDVRPQQIALLIRAIREGRYKGLSFSPDENWMQSFGFADRWIAHSEFAISAETMEDLSKEMVKDLSKEKDFSLTVLQGFLLSLGMTEQENHSWARNGVGSDGETIRAEETEADGTQAWLSAEAVDELRAATAYINKQALPLRRGEEEVSPQMIAGLIRTFRGLRNEGYNGLQLPQAEDWIKKSSSQVSAETVENLFSLDGVSPQVVQGLFLSLGMKQQSDGGWLAPRISVGTIRAEETEAGGTQAFLSTEAVNELRDLTEYIQDQDRERALDMGAEFSPEDIARFILESRIVGAPLLHNTEMWIEYFGFELSEATVGFLFSPQGGVSPKVVQGLFLSLGMRKQGDRWKRSSVGADAETTFNTDPIVEITHEGSVSVTSTEEGGVTVTSSEIVIVAQAQQLGAQYFRGELKSTPIPFDFRASVEADVEDVTAMAAGDPATLQLERQGAEPVLQGKVHFGILAAGASSRMNTKEAPEDIRRKLGSEQQLESKAAVPIVFNPDGTPFRYLDAAGVNLSRFLEALAAGARRAGIAAHVYDNTFGIMTNALYRSEHEGIIAAQDDYGIPAGQIKLWEQPVALKYVATPEDVNNLYRAKKFKTEEAYQEALAISEEAWRRFYEEGDAAAVIYPGEQDPAGHGEFLHQMIVNGVLLDIVDHGQQWITVRNIDNYAAKYDRMFLRILGLAVANDLDFIAEVSPRAPGQKGGALYKRKDSDSMFLAEDPSLNATLNEDGSRKVDPSEAFWMNNATGIMKVSYIIDLYKQPGQSDEEFLQELRKANYAQRLEIAARGREKFPKLLDPKPAKDGKGATTKTETNLWQSTNVTSPDIKIGAAGVQSARNFPIDNYDRLSPQEQQEVLAGLRFLATKQWDRTEGEKEKIRVDLAKVLGHQPSEKAVALTLESYVGNAFIAQALVDYIKHAKLINLEMFAQPLGDDALPPRPSAVQPPAGDATVSTETPGDANRGPVVPPSPTVQQQQQQQQQSGRKRQQLQQQQQQSGPSQGDQGSKKADQPQQPDPVIKPAENQEGQQPTEKTEKKGGIDLDPKLLDLVIERDENFVPLPMDQQPVNIQIDGLMPVIIQIRPVTSLPMILGFNLDEPAENDSRQAGSGADIAPAAMLHDRWAVRDLQDA